MTMDIPQQSPTPAPKQGSGKLLASVFASTIVIHGAAYIRSHYNFDTDQETMLNVEAALIGFWVWLTPQSIISSIKGLISDWKDIVRTWNQP